MDLLRLFNTVKYLRPVQLYSRVWFRLFRPTPDLCEAPGLRTVSGLWVLPVGKPKSLISLWRFRFLNEERECSFPGDWNRAGWNKLWLYNLHYFDCLSAGGRCEPLVELISRWVDDNPPGSGNGWEPYPSSLRIVNWIKWSLAGNELSGEVLQSLAIQVRYLRKRLEYHLLGNHLFANGKALVFAGLFFVGVEAEAWLEKGLSILGREIPEQVLEDGGHFERSPMYHSIIFEDILDLINLFRAFGRDVPELWGAVVGKMGCWLKVMSHPDGDIALFNDAALRIAAKPDKLFDYLERVTGEVVENEDGCCFALASSGYYVMAPRCGDRLLVDCGEIGPDYLPGHAHCDMLSFELSLAGCRIVVDSGCGVYVDGRERRYNRGNVGHNTVTVDGLNQSEIWGAHRCARRARPVSARLVDNGDCLQFEGSPDGYRRLSGDLMHHREIVWCDDLITVTDVVDGGGRHDVGGRLHLHPELSFFVEDGRVVVAVNDGCKVVVETLSGLGLQVEKGYYCPEFGKFIECSVVTWSEQDVQLPFTGGFRLLVEIDK